jgi:hypothetical protein
MITVFLSCDWVHLVDVVLREWKSTLTPTSGCWHTSGGVSYEFGLTRIWLKTCFDLAVQGCTRVGRLGNPLQNLVGIVTPSTLWHRSSALRFSPVLEPWRMQFMMQSLRHDVIHPEPGYMIWTGHGTDKACAHFSSLAQGCRSGCGDIVEK